MSQKPQTQTTVNQIDPAIARYVDFGLGQAKTMYQNPDQYFPQYFPGATYVAPSQETEAARLALANRATQGSALKPAATMQQLNTIGGQYLNANNPYLANALQGGFNQATTEYNRAVNQALSNASMAGRYGSGAMNTALNSANTALANAMSSQAGQLAYQNYAQERARQEAAAQMYPQLAAADYTDINQLLQAGQLGESYQEAALQDAINRFNYGQTIPQQNLSQFMSYVYGSAPLAGRVQSTPVFRNTGGNILGGALTGASIGNAIPGVGTAIGAGLGGLLGLL